MHFHCNQKFPNHIQYFAVFTLPDNHFAIIGLGICFPMLASTLKTPFVCILTNKIYFLFVAISTLYKYTCQCFTTLPIFIHTFHVFFSTISFCFHCYSFMLVWYSRSCFALNNFLLITFVAIRILIFACNKCCVHLFPIDIDNIHYPLFY